MIAVSKHIAPFDVNAQRFIFAAGLTRYAEKIAINYLVSELKKNNLWVKMAAIWPFVGGNVYSAKLNLMNPINSDLGYRLTFVASPTISVNGVDWNGTTQYANTNFNPSLSPVLLLDSTHMSYYSREDTTGAFAEIGATINNPPLVQNYLGIKNQYSINTGSGTSFANTDTRGFFISSRTASNLTTEYRNGISVSTATTVSSALPNGIIYIGARNNQGAAATFSNRQCAFASTGEGLSSSEAFIFSSIVQQFQIILNRAV